MDADIALMAADAKISRGLHEYLAALLKRLHSLEGKAPPPQLRRHDHLIALPASRVQ